MRTVTFTRTDTVELVDKPVPDIGPTEVLLEVAGAGLCHSDLAIIGQPDSPLIGSTLGHEVAGTVAEVGTEVTDWSAGDTALVALVLSCGRCRECLAGRDNQCRTVAPRSAPAPLSPGIGSPGGMAEYIAVQARHLDPLSGLDPVDSAPLSDAGLTPMHAINSARDRLTTDSTALVLGLGGLGHMGLQILSATTGVRIIAADTDPEKVAYAAEHGADLAIPSDADTAARVLDETDGIGADAVFDFVGVQPTVDIARGCVAVGGALRFVGLGGGGFDYVAGSGSGLPWGVDVQRSYGGTRADMGQVLALARAGRISVQTQRRDLGDAPRAFADLDSGTVQGRIVLVP